MQLFDENEELVGELFFNLISGFKEKIKINQDVFKIKNARFLGTDIEIVDQNDKLLIESDILQSILIYYGSSKEIYTYENADWFNNKMSVFRKSELVITINKKGIFQTQYEIKVADGFKNYLVILTFLNFYIRILSND